MKIKLITGFRKDQEYTIDADEAHKAYYLFLNPEKRGVFNNGLAIIGSNIQEIVPDYQSTMGWNSTHALDGDDWNEIRAKGIDRKMRDIMAYAKEISSTATPEQLSQPITLLMGNRIHSPQPKRIGFTSMGNIING